jgi:hypothetical protein
LFSLIFFIEHAGELRIIILRRKNRLAPFTTPILLHQIHYIRADSIRQTRPLQHPGFTLNFTIKSNTLALLHYSLFLVLSFSQFNYCISTVADGL